MKWYNWIIVLGLIGWIMEALDNPDCDKDGCKREGIGWVNEIPYGSLCKGVPCRPMGAERGTGYCSRDHALSEL